jgi:tetratricopeptide (TPR) repeat protein
MKTIKIFLASSEELDYDRMAFGNLVRRLDDMYEKRGIRIKLFEWEDYDSAYNDKRKQDEYNEYVKQSDIFLALFHKKAGQFTIEEFNKASEQFRATASPKVYTYCKDLKPGEEESKELKDFKKHLFDEIGHYWCRYDNRESLQFQFVMQLQLVESNRMDEVKVEDGIVTINGLPVAQMEKLKFATANEEYLKMQNELKELYEEICDIQSDLEENQSIQEKKKSELKDKPSDKECQQVLKKLKNDEEKLINRLQRKKDKYNRDKSDLSQQQLLFLNTAKRVAQLQGEYINYDIRNAIDAFNEGKVKVALYILERSEYSKPSLEDYKLSKEITEQKRQNQIIYINKLLLWTSTIMADASTPIHRRIRDTDEKYKEAIERAIVIGYDEKKYINLLSDYVDFSYKYARYDVALKYEQEILTIRESRQDTQPSDIADSYNMMGLIYKKKWHYKEALDYHKKALKIRKEYLGDVHLDTANSYNNIGSIYRYDKDYSNALDFYQKALIIKTNIFGEEHLYTADSYNNVGLIHYLRGNYSQALVFFQKALDIYEKELGADQLDTAISYNNVGNVHYQNGEYSLALKYHMKALEIRRTCLGNEHPDTAMSYYNIGLIYNELGHDDTLSLEYYKKALKLFEKKELHSVNCSAQSYYLKRFFAIRSEKLNTPEQYQEEVSHSRFFNHLKQTETSILNNSNTDYKYEGNSAQSWVKRAYLANSSDIAAIEAQAALYEGMGAFREALKQFELCLKLYIEQENSAGIQKTEAKIAELKKLMNSAT